MIDTMGKKKVTDKDVNERVMEINKKKCSPSF